MHHQNVIAHDNVSLVPDMIVGYPSIMKDRIDGLADCRTVGCVKSINGDICWLELSLGLGPRLMIPETRLACRWMRRNHRKSFEDSLVKGGC